MSSEFRQKLAFLQTHIKEFIKMDWFLVMAVVHLMRLSVYVYPRRFMENLSEISLSTNLVSEAPRLTVSQSA